MQIDFITVLIAVIALIVLAVPGYLIVKTKLVGEDTTSAFSALVLYVCAPAQVFMGFQKETYRADIGVNMLIVAGITFLLHFVMIGLMYLFVRGKDDEAKKRAVRLSSVFGNAAYMGLPFLQILFNGTATYGEIIVYASVFISVFNILTWTVGVYMITGDSKEVSFKKVALHPVILAVVFGLLLFLTVKQPLVSTFAVGTPEHSLALNLMNSVDMIGNMVTPMAMFVIGMRLAKINLKQLFLDKWAYVVALFKLVVISVITIVVLMVLPLSEPVKYALFFLMSMPSAASSALLAVRYGGDGDFASVSVLLSTVLSIATIPLMYLLFNALV